jgi:hypothetical protein
MIEKQSEDSIEIPNSSWPYTVRVSRAIPHPSLEESIEIETRLKKIEETIDGNEKKLKEIDKLLERLSNNIGVVDGRFKL